MSYRSNLPEALQRLCARSSGPIEPALGRPDPDARRSASCSSASGCRRTGGSSRSSRPCRAARPSTSPRATGMTRRSSTRSPCSTRLPTTPPSRRLAPTAASGKRHGSATASSPPSGVCRRRSSAGSATPWGCGRCSDGRHVRRRVRRVDALPLLQLRRGERGRPREREAVVILDPAPTGSARASSSTTPASTPPSPCGTPATTPSWSTATQRPCPPTTTRAAGCTSSRSPSRTSWKWSTPSRRPGRWQASSSSSADRRRSGWPRPSRTRACTSSARPPRRSTSPKTAARSAGCSPRPTCPHPGMARHTASRTRSRWRASSATPCSCARPTCSADAAWRSSTTTRR